MNNIYAKHWLNPLRNVSEAMELHNWRHFVACLVVALASIAVSFMAADLFGKDVMRRFVPVSFVLGAYGARFAAWLVSPPPR